MIHFRPPRLLGQAAVSVLDQAWLSALNLMLGLLLIRLASKESYGVYAQLFAAGLFATSFLEAVVFNPLVNLVAGKRKEDRAIIIGYLDRYQRRLSILIAIVLGGICAWVSAASGQSNPLVLGIVFAVFVKANAAREYARSVAFLEFRPGQVLRIDVVYGVGVMLGVAGLVWFAPLRIDYVFAVLACANIAALIAADSPSYPATREEEGYREAIQQMWKRGRLGLPGAILAWIVNYSYLFLVAAWLGASAAADLNASRLLLMPISLSVVAWSRVARPRIGSLVGQNEQGQLDRLLILSLLAMQMLTIFYVAALWLALPWLKVHVLGSKYDSVGSLLLLWGIYFAVNAGRWVGTAALMGKDRYGFLLVGSVVCFVVMFIALGVAVPLYGVRGVIMALIVVECLSFAITWTIYRYARAS